MVTICIFVKFSVDATKWKQEKLKACRVKEVDASIYLVIKQHAMPSNRIIVIKQRGFNEIKSGANRGEPQCSSNH